MITAHALGFITHISDGYVGSAADDDIVINSGVLDLLPPGSTLLVDKGFLRLAAECAKRGIREEIPPRRAKGQIQQQAHEVQRTANIANPRVVIERLIGRVKTLFPWLTITHPVGLYDVFTSAFRVACLWTSLLAPLTDKRRHTEQDSTPREAMDESEDHAYAPSDDGDGGVDQATS